jgi:hypothetical protein
MNNDDNDINYVYIIDKNTQEIITSINENSIDYLLKLVHKDLDDQGFWTIDEENALDTLDIIKDRFDKTKKQ